MTLRSAPPVTVPDRPRIVVVLHADGSGTVNGRRIRIPAGADARTVLMTESCRFAATLGRPVRVQAHDPDAVWALVAHPDGSVTPAGRGRGGRRFRRPTLQRRDRGGPAAAVDLPQSDPDAGRAASAATSARPGSLSDPVTRPAWYQAPNLATRPQPGGSSVPASVPMGTPVPGPGLAMPGPIRPGSRTGAVIWSGRARPRRPPSAVLVPVLIVATLGIAALIGLTVPRADDAAGTARAPGIAQGGNGGALAGSAGLAALKVAVPPGYSVMPAWSAPIAGWTRSAATDDGTILTRDPQGQVLLLDPVDGHRLWASAGTTTSTEDGPWPATLDGARVAALAGQGRLTYWVLPARGSSASTSPGTAPDKPSSAPVVPGKAIIVPLPAGAKVTWAGPGPLIQLDDQTIGVIRSGALVRVPLPAGARGLAADDRGVLAATGTTWVRQPAAQAPVAPRPIPRPNQAGSAPLRVEAVGTSLLVTIWPKAKGTGQVVALMDTTSGANVVQTEVTSAADLRAFGVVREVGGTQLAIGPVVVDTYAAKVDLLDLRYEVKTLTRGHAWTVFQGRATDLLLTPKGDFTTVPFAAGEAALPVGVSRLGETDNRAVVVTAAGSGWLLSGLGTA